MKDKLNKLFNNKKIVILGMGREGTSSYQFIKKFYPSTELTTRDQKEGKDYLDDLTSFDLIIKSPGISWNLPKIKEAKNRGILFSSQTQIFLELFRDQVVGVTGTKGKSTTSALIYHILSVSEKKVKLVGNIGSPVLDYVDGEDHDTTFVFEMSSHQLSDVKVSPHVAVFLNIYPEHMDYYLDFDAYFEAKANITKFQKKGDLFIYCSDFKEIKDLAKTTLAKKLPFSKNDSLSKFGIGNARSQLIGDHNLNNIKASALVVKSLGVLDSQVIKEAVETFKPLSGRLEKVGVYKTVTFICDTLATIPESAVEALASYPDKKITLILGGFDRGLNFDVLAKEVTSRNNVENIVLIGMTAKKIKEALDKCGYQGKILNLGIVKMQEIVKSSFNVTKRNGLVLLSPACTSFDMFKDYQDRADQFKAAVNSL